MFNKSEIEKLTKSADIRNYIPDLHGNGVHKWTTCPFCGDSRKGKGLVTYRPKNESVENAAHCHSCDKGFGNTIFAVMHYENLKYIEAVEFLASKEGFYLVPKEEPKKEYKRKKQEVHKIIESFCDKQLAASGLTVQDVTAVVKDKDGNEIQIPTFVKGGYDTKTWTYNFNDDEMLIFYYNLDGDLVKFASRGVAGVVTKAVTESVEFETDDNIKEVNNAEFEFCLVKMNDFGEVRGDHSRIFNDTYNFVYG